MTMTSPPQPMTTMEPVYDGIRKGHVIMVGQTRYGKTTAARYFFNSNGLFDGRKKPIHIFIDTKHDDELLDIGYMVSDPVEFAYHLDIKSKRIVYRPPGTSKRRQHLNAIVNMLFHYKSRPSHARVPFVLFIDEFQLYASKQERNEGLELLATTGAGKDIHGVFLAQRLQDIHEQSYSQCNTIISFYMKERPEYLRSKVLSELIEWLPWLKANRYYFAFMDYEGEWHLHAPVPLEPPKSDFVRTPTW